MATNEHGPRRLSETGDSVDHGSGPVGNVRLGEFGCERQRQEPAVEVIGRRRPNMFNRNTIDGMHLVDHELHDGFVRQRNQEFVDDPAAPGFENLDTEHVTFDGTDAAGYLTQRAGSIGKPNTNDNGVGQSLFTSLGNSGAAYDTRVRAMVALLMTLPRFQEQ